MSLLFVLLLTTRYYYSTKSPRMTRWPRLAAFPYHRENMTFSKPNARVVTLTFKLMKLNLP